MQTLEIIGAVIGLVYLWLEYRASIYLWIAGIIMPAIYIFVFYRAGFYADMGISVYYVLASFYGIALWLNGRRVAGKRNGQVKEEPLPAESGQSGQGEGAGRAGVRPITRTPRKLYPLLVTTAVLFTAVISWVLINYTDSDVPYGDSFTTALSIVGMWMLARKYVEQWLAWIVVDVVCCGLYFYKALYPTAILYGLYSVIAVLGYFKWLKMMREDEVAV